MTEPKKCCGNCREGRPSSYCVSPLCVCHVAPNAQDTTTAPPTPDAPTSLDLIVADLQSKGYKVTNADAYKGNYFQYRPTDVPKLEDDMDAPKYDGHITITKNELGSYPLPGDPRYAPTEGWEERLLGIFLECTGMPGKHLAWRDYMVPEIRETITQALAEQKARMVEELKEKSKLFEMAENGTADASVFAQGVLSAYRDIIKALSK